MTQSPMARCRDGRSIVRVLIQLLQKTRRAEKMWLCVLTSFFKTKLYFKF